MKVVLLHAFPLDERMWDGIDVEDAVAPRLYGRSNTIDGWATAILGEVEGDLAAIGASMGGYCALALLRRAPDRVQALALVGSRAEADTPERRAGRDETIRLISEQGVEALWDEMRPRLFPEEADAEVVARARSLALDRAPDELVAAIEAMRDRPDSTQAARSFEGPALVAVGEHDPFFSPEEARALAESMPDARAHVFAGCGHLPSLERAEEFGRVLRELLERA